MGKTSAVLGSALFFAVAPTTVAGLIPWSITGWEFRPPFFDLEATRAAGIALILAGLPVLVDSFARFALQGLGTPAPIAPPTKLVVTGFYRHTRNPMYVGLAVTMLGEALLFGSRPILWEALIVTLGFHVFVLIYEEPTLRQSFGEQYETYRANVPRWLPRWTAWTQPG